MTFNTIAMKTSFVLSICLLVSNTFFSQSINKTKILVLGTPHLEQLENFHPNYLKRVLDSLKTKKMDVVAIENMPAELLLDIRGRRENHWQDLYISFNTFIEFGLSHQKNMNMSFEEAIKIIDGLNLKENIVESDRMDYINSYLCTYDVWSATLFYKELKDKSKLSKLVIDLLEKSANSMNEINTIGLEIASANQLKKINYIDNLQDETLLLHEFPMFMNEYQANSRTLNELINLSNIYERASIIENEAIEQKDLYKVYQFYNSKEYMNGDLEGQWYLWFKTNFDSKSDRSRYSLWEMRNLSIAANLLRVVASHPEKTILVVIGASHKSFLEKYLKQIPDVELLELF